MTAKPYLAHTKPHHRGHYIARIIIYCSLAVGVSVLAVAWGLGFRFNPYSREINQVGTVSISLNQSLDDAQAVFDSSAPLYDFPVNNYSLRPGSYQLTMTAPGYQTWSTSFSIAASEYHPFADIFLIPTKTTSKQIVCGDSLPENTTGLTLKDGEIWKQDQLLWRQSATFIGASWVVRDRVAAVLDTEGVITVIGMDHKIGQQLHSGVSNPQSVRFTNNNVSVCGASTGVEIPLRTPKQVSLLPRL